MNEICKILTDSIWIISVFIGLLYMLTSLATTTHRFHTFSLLFLFYYKIEAYGIIVSVAVPVSRVPNQLIDYKLNLV